MKKLLAAAVLLGTPLHAQTERPIGVDTPAALHGALKDMGFAPEALDLSGAPSTVITSNDSRYWVVLGGCTDKKACKTLMVGSTFTDVLPPPDWVNKQNESFDLLKVWLNDKKQLSYSVQVPTAGLTRPQLRALVDALNASAGQLGQDAIEAKLVK
jgi:Putative bacterial sensory transduction regulator